MPREAIREWLAVYLKGLFMGTADAIPGVSGGTIALITGIYERLVGAITGLDPSLLAHVPRLHTADGRRALYRDLRERDVPFLVVLGLGIGSAVVVVARLVHLARGAAPALTFAFFFGLIAASAVVIYRTVPMGTAPRIAVSLVGFAIAFLVSGASTSGGLPHTLPLVFVAGAIAVSAMVLPGISGAFFLLLLGQYYHLSGTLNRFTGGLVALADGGAAGALVGPGTTILAFGGGAVVGLLTVAHAIDWALDRYHAATLSFLVSLMVGALRLPAVRVLEHTAAWTPGAVAATGGTVAVGVGAVLLLDRYTDDLTGYA